MAKRVFILVVFALLSFSGTANDLLNKLTNNSSNASAFLPVDQAFQFNFLDNPEGLELSWLVEPEHYLYKQQIEVVDGERQLELILPPAKPYEDPYFGTVDIYDSDLRFTINQHQLAGAEKLKVTYQGCAKAGLCYPPETKWVYLSGQTPASNTSGTAATAIQAVPATSGSAQDQFAERLEQSSLWLNVGVFLLIGIGLAFTPCVFPMYPILTGIIAGQKSKPTTAQSFALSMSYVQGMALTYTVLGLVVASAGLQFQAALQHPYILIGLSLLFIALALSMFGLYSLQVPARWQEKLNQLSAQQRGGSLVGAGVMGMISGLVASPCTAAPLSGVLLYIAQSGDLVLGGVALYSLSLGMGIPLLLIGTSSGHLLPKAGAWMELVKVAFGFLLLAVPILLLERILPIQLVPWLWVALILSAAIYYYHQNRLTALSFGQTLRQLFLVAVMLGAVAWVAKPYLGVSALKQQEHVEFIQVKGLAEMQQQLALAKQQGKPAMVDFYADWCTACKQFEHQTFSQPAVAAKLNQMVLIQADVTKTDASAIELLGHYQVLGLPTLMLFDAEGNEQPQARVTGFMNEEAFMAHLLLNGF